MCKRKTDIPYRTFMSRPLDVIHAIASTCILLLTACLQLLENIIHHFYHCCLPPFPEIPELIHSMPSQRTVLVELSQGNFHCIADNVTILGP